MFSEVIQFNDISDCDRPLDKTNAEILDKFSLDIGEKVTEWIKKVIETSGIEPLSKSDECNVIPPPNELEREASNRDFQYFKCPEEIPLEVNDLDE